MKRILAVLIFMSLSLCIKSARADEELSDFGNEKTPPGPKCLAIPERLGTFNLLLTEYHEDGSADIVYVKRRSRSKFEIVRLARVACAGPLQLIRHDMVSKEKKECPDGATCI